MAMKRENVSKEFRRKGVLRRCYEYVLGSKKTKDQSIDSESVSECKDFQKCYKSVQELIRAEEKSIELSKKELTVEVLRNCKKYILELHESGEFTGDGIRFDLDDFLCIEANMFISYRGFNPLMEDPDRLAMNEWHVLLQNDDFGDIYIIWDRYDRFKKLRDSQVSLKTIF